MDHEHRAGEIFVFGSNLAGIHGAGAAKYARDWCEAEMGVGEGMTGYAYAIPTKDKRLRPLSKERIHTAIKTFIKFADDNRQYKFFLTKVACGLAGFSEDDIAPLFQKCPANIRKPPGW